ncbi:MAG: hypothetical protein IT207_03735 [Fimbriimonadaceae bacterium]|nr:hypothetical protein [Fimbriimonadaceae bacterium]
MPKEAGKHPERSGGVDAWPPVGWRWFAFCSDAGRTPWQRRGLIALGVGRGVLGTGHGAPSALPRRTLVPQKSATGHSETSTGHSKTARGDRDGKREAAESPSVGRAMPALPGKARRSEDRERCIMGEWPTRPARFPVHFLQGSA